MENSDHFALGRCFNSFDEVQRTKQDFEEKTFQMIHMKDSKKTETAAKHTGKNYKSELKYDFIQLKCYHGGKKFKSKSNNIRKHEKTAKIDCPFTINIRSTKDGKQLQVKSVTGEYNHPVTEMEYRYVPYIIPD